MIDHRGRLAAAALLLVAVAGCDRPDGNVAGNAANPLERAARDRGIVGDSETQSAVGLYERDHELGRDALCLAGDDADDLRFGVVGAFGPGLTCQASGTATQDGTVLTLRFAKAQDCTIEASLDADLVRFPGRLPAACDALCPDRATLAGLEFPRVGWTAGDAAQLVIKGAGKSAAVPPNRPCATGRE